MSKTVSLRKTIRKNDGPQSTATTETPPSDPPALSLIHI